MRFPIALYLHWTPRETSGGWAVFCLRDRFSGPKWLHLTVGLPSDRRNRKLAAAITTEPPKAELPISAPNEQVAARPGAVECAAYPKRWRNKNAEAYIPLPQATRRRVCVGLYVIHFLLCDFPALGRAFLNSENLSKGVPKELT